MSRPEHSPDSDPDVTPRPGATAGQRKLAWILLVVIGPGVAALDLWTKEVAFDALGVDMDSIEFVEDPDSGRRLAHFQLAPGVTTRQIEFIEGLWAWEASLNTGAFSGWFGDHTFALAILSFVALFVIAWILHGHLRRPERPDFFFIVALCLLWGGTLGNFYDRYFIGAVRDFIKWYYGDFVWPNFNIADSAICVGVACMAIHILFDSRRAAHETGESG